MYVRKELTTKKTNIFQFLRCVKVKQFSLNISAMSPQNNVRGTWSYLSVLESENI